MNPNKHIIIVDDDLVNNFVCEILCKEYFHTSQVQSFIDEEIAIEYIVQHKAEIGLLLMDLNMPKLSGWEFLEALSAKFTLDFPIFVLTSSINVDDEKKANEDPRIYKFIVKPLTKGILHEYFLLHEP